MGGAVTTGELVVWGTNPDRSTPGAVQMSKEVDLIRYIRDAPPGKGKPYEHAFERRGFRLEALPDGSVRVYHPTLPVWKDM